MGTSSTNDPISDVRGQRFELMAENFEDVFWMFDADLTEVLYVNDMVEEIYGLTPEELRDNPMAFLEEVHPDYRNLVQDKLAELRNGNRVKLEYPVNSQCNFTRWVNVQGVPLTDESGTVNRIIGSSREITDQKQAEQRLEEEKDRFKSIVYLQESVAESNPDLEKVMQTVVDEILKITRADGAVIALAEGEELIYRATSGSLRDQTDLTLDLEDSLSGLCYLDGSFKRSPDVENDNRVNSEVIEESGMNCRSMLIIPLQYSGECFGILKIVSAEPEAFDATEENVLNILSGMVSASIYQALQYLEKERFLDQVQTMALTDPLTGLPNRRSLMIELNEEIERSNRTGNPFSLGILDLDHFKKVNDTYGHLKGDEVLEKVARILRNTTRTVDTPGRYGGEEFGLLLPETSVNDGEILMTRVLEELRAEEFSSNGETFQVTASVGLTEYRDSEELESVIQRADNALYEAKETGRNRIVTN